MALLENLSFEPTLKMKIVCLLQLKIFTMLRLLVKIYWLFLTILNYHLIWQYYSSRLTKEIGNTHNILVYFIIRLSVLQIILTNQRWFVIASHWKAVFAFLLILIFARFKIQSYQTLSGCEISPYVERSFHIDLYNKYRLLRLSIIWLHRYHLSVLKESRIYHWLALRYL